MFIKSVLTSGSLPSLEATLMFASQRRDILAHNIANLSTPGFIPRDVPPATFQQVLGKAVDERRSRLGGQQGELRLARSRQIEPDGRGGFTLKPATAADSVLFHDRNNRDLERTMQDLAENASVHRIATELIRTRVAHLHAAIGERV